MHSNEIHPETNSAKRKTPKELSEDFRHRLNSYALAACSAGVAVLAGALPLGAAPVCKTLHLSLVATDTYAFNPADQQIEPFNIAITYNNVSSLTLGWWNRGFFIPNSAGAMALLAANKLPSDVHYGERIGPGEHFGRGQSYGLLFTYGPLNGGTLHHHKGNLQFGPTNYIGFQFSRSGETLYGWVRLKVTFGGTGDGLYGTMHIHGYGYETIPNTAIKAGQCSESDQASEANENPTRSALDSVAPAASPARHRLQPPSLGMLALGAEGIPFWRDRK